MHRISVPYIDQPAPFWRSAIARFGEHLDEVYFPLPRSIFGSGRWLQPANHVLEFLEIDELPKTVLLNAPAFDLPLGETMDRVFPILDGLRARFLIKGAVVRDIDLMRETRRAFAGLEICASTLMEIAEPAQVESIRGWADVLVPASWIVRDHRRLSALRRVFAGRIKILVNEGCLVRCPWREAHFKAMNLGIAARPLCAECVEEEPWRRLTGAWILPQHLDLLQGLFDVVKVSGRGTLLDPARWMGVVEAYFRGEGWDVHEIGMSTAGPREPIPITREFYESTLHCRKNCDSCTVCRDYYARSAPSRH
ncbi:MAG: hypothetical protein HY720_16140 [Planctomycetes bacterium]|nr:hypothetical protein [Planctomycetota bacterium]